MNDSKPITLRQVLDFVYTASKEDRTQIIRALNNARGEEIREARDAFKVGDKVEFTVTKRGWGNTVVGTVVRKNVKTIHVRPADGSREWKVTASLLRKHEPKAAG